MKKAAKVVKTQSFRNRQFIRIDKVDILNEFYTHHSHNEICLFVIDLINQHH